MTHDTQNGLERSTGTLIRAAFREQGEWCVRLGSPFTGLLCAVIADRLDMADATGRRVLGWSGDPRGDALPMRLLGGLNALVRGGHVPALAGLYPPNPAPDPDVLGAALVAVLRDHADALGPWLDSAPQTNEVARSGVLMPGMMAVARDTGLPLRILELGASAGLNLRMDDYGYRLGGTAAGRAESDVQLEPDWKGEPPKPVTFRIAARRGVDLNPLDVTDAATRERLLAYVWPDQPLRLHRLTAALDAAAKDPPSLDKADAADWVEQHAFPSPMVATVVFHSIAFQYFPATVQARIAAHMERAGAMAKASAPLAWLRFELDDPDRIGPPPTLRLRLWPGGDDRLLAHTHPHGASIRWLGD